MFGPTPLRDIFLVASFEVREMLRTRRALILIVLYMLGGLVAAWGFVEILAQLENGLAKVMQAGQVTTPGALTRQLMQSPQYRSMFQQMFKDQAVVEFLVGMPAIALFFMWSSLKFVPILIVITASDTVAQETQTRGIRFASFRTGRVELVVGKYLGQTLLMALVVGLAGSMYLLVAWRGLQGFELLPTLKGLAIFWPRAVIYGMSFVGLTALCSMNASSANVARFLALLGFFGSLIASGVLEHYAKSNPWVLWDFLLLLLPFQYQEKLWNPDLVSILSSAGPLLVLTVLYVGLGLLVFRRRDL